MAFDEKRYLREVLEPARQAGDAPPEDLLVRYQLEEPLSAQAVAETVPAVQACWRRARRELKFRKLVTRLEADHARLAPVLARAATGDLDALRRAAVEASDAPRRRLARLVSDLNDLAGPLRLMAPVTVAELADQHEVTPPEVEDLLHKRGVQIREPDPLPTEPPVAGYPRYREALRTLGCRHALDFLCSGPGRPAWPDAKAVQATDRDWAARPHDGNTTLASSVLVVLKTALTDRGEDGLNDLVRYELAEELRARHRRGASAAALLGHATGELGVGEEYARHLVFAVRLEQLSTPATERANGADAGQPGPAPADTEEAAARNLPAARPPRPAAVAPAGRLSATPPRRGGSPADTHATTETPGLERAHGVVVARRQGGDVALSWDWPDELAEVILRWRRPHDAWHETAVSRAIYEAQGGAWVPASGDGAVEITVTPVLTRRGQRVVGRPVAVAVPPQEEARYEVIRGGLLWRRELVLTFTADRHVELGPLLVVLRRGAVMPLRPDDGEVIAKLERVAVRPGVPTRLALPAPRVVGPYWLRCFATDSAVMLRDPPVSQLRGR